MSDKPRLNDALTAELIGSRVLIGVTVRDSDDDPDSAGDRVQMHGVVEAVDPEAGVKVALEGTREGETHWLPPDPHGFVRARPGEYRLSATGEVVKDPDFVTTWDITRPSKDRA